ncbi:MAG: hypothetical protein AABY22_01620 [Nanoarchaeota archaeon]
MKNSLQDQKDKRALIGTFFKDWEAAKAYCQRAREDKPEADYIIVSFDKGFLVFDRRQIRT